MGEVSNQGQVPELSTLEVDNQRKAAEIVLSSDEISRPTEPKHLPILPTDRL